jgi:hypothetical protein
MDIIARKLNFIQEFLKISDEELLEKLEKTLRVERKKLVESDLKPMSMAEFNSMIDASEVDFINGRANEAHEVLKKVDQW